ncbi:acyltransferase family protein [Aquihabitans sp. G128]|nr:acyltransferase family protein [Aquihabitans sp. G128]
MAVAAVVAYHLGRLPGGFLGVDVFFVVSGFLITRLLLAEHERTGVIGLRRFWLRRFRRLVPALVAVLVVVAVASRAWLPGWRLAGVRDDAFAALAYVANWRFVASGQSYFAQGEVASPLRHTWSLAIEEQFYVVWPLAVAVLLRLARRAAPVVRRQVVGVAAAAAGLASAGWMALASGGHGDLSRLYYGTDTRLFALAAGAALACWFDGRAPYVPLHAEKRPVDRWVVAAPLAAVGLAGLALLLATDQRSAYRGPLQVASLLAVALVAGAATGRGRLARCLAWRPLVWVGQRSYGLYLWSWPVQVLAAAHLGLAGWRLDAAVVAAASALAIASHALVETPFRTGRPPRVVALRLWAWRPPQVGRPAARFAPPAIAAVAVVVVLVALAAGAPARPSYLAVRDDQVLDAALAPPVAPPAADDDQVAVLSARAEAAAPTLAPSSTVVVPSAPSPTTALAPAPQPPGPFDPDAPVVLDPTAAAPPSSARGRPLHVLVTGDSVGWSIGWNVRGRLADGTRVDDRALIACGVVPPRRAVRDRRRRAAGLPVALRPGWAGRGPRPPGPARRGAPVGGGVGGLRPGGRRHPPRGRVRRLRRPPGVPAAAADRHLPRPWRPRRPACGAVLRAAGPVARRRAGRPGPGGLGERADPPRRRAQPRLGAAHRPDAHALRRRWSGPHRHPGRDRPARGRHPPQRAGRRVVLGSLAVGPAGGGVPARRALRLRRPSGTGRSDSPPSGPSR